MATGLAPNGMGNVTRSTDVPCRLVAERVADVVLRLPKTLSADTCLADARAALCDDHVHMLLLTDRGRLVGTLLRSDLPGTTETAGDREEFAPVLPFGIMAGRTVSSQFPAEEAWQILIRRGERRLAVVDSDGTLLGLLCLKRPLTGFCSDADVAVRAADPRSLARLSG